MTRARVVVGTGAVAALAAALFAAAWLASEPGPAANPGPAGPAPSAAASAARPEPSAGSPTPLELASPGDLTAVGSAPGLTLLDRLLEQVRAGDPDAANALEEQLAALGDAALPALRQALLTPGAGPDAVELRQRVAWILGQIGSPAAVALLAEGLQIERVPDVRGQLVLAAAQVHDALTTDLLVGVAGDPQESARVRESAIGLLGKQGEARATGALLDALSHEAEPEQRALLLRWLGESGDVLHAGVALERALSEEDAAGVRASAARGLGRLGGPSAVTALRRALSGDASPNVRMAAAAALAGLGEAGALEPALGDPADGVRATAIQGLGRVGGPAAAQALAKALRGDSDPLNRLYAARGLAASGGAPAQSALEEAAGRDRDPQVRAECARLLAAPAPR